MTDATLTAEDAKLVTLARATRARVGAAEGAAVRDTDGRTYAAASVELSALRLGAVQACVALAISAGSAGLEAVVRLSESDVLSPDEAAVLREFGGSDVLVHLGDPRGRVLSSAPAGVAY